MTTPALLLSSTPGQEGQEDGVINRRLSSGRQALSAAQKRAMVRVTQLLAAASVIYPLLASHACSTP